MGFKYDDTPLGSTTSPRSDLEGSKTLKASHVTDLDSSIRRFVNYGIGADEIRDPAPYDLDTRNTYSEHGWVDSQHIFKPEFYGSPDPRMTAVSGATHFRETNSNLSEHALFNYELTGSTYAPVPGLCARIKLKHDSTVYINASFYAYEIGGIARTPSWQIALNKRDGSPSDVTPHEGYLGRAAADFVLHINGNFKSGTKRRLFVSTLIPHSACFGDTDSWPYGDDGDNSFGSPHSDFSTTNQLNDGQLFFNMLSRQQFAIVFAAQLPAGIHDMGIYCRPTANETYIEHDKQYQAGRDDSYSHMLSYGVEHGDWPLYPGRKHIFVGARNFVVDAYHNGPMMYSDTV